MLTQGVTLLGDNSYNVWQMITGDTPRSGPCQRLRAIRHDLVRSYVQWT